MKQYGLLCLLVLCIFGSHAQDSTTAPLPDWNGDPNLCTVESTIQPPSRPLPTFSDKAEFGVEQVTIRHFFNRTPSDLVLSQYLYDYNANKLILIRNHNGFIDVEYFYYEALKKSNYYRGHTCVVEAIETNIDADGFSAIKDTNNTWHIRKLSEFLVFSSNDPRRPTPLTPKWIRQDNIRGIPVDIWESCVINKTSYHTVRRLWAIAQKGHTLPTGVVGDLAVPIQENRSMSFSFPNGTQQREVDRIYNFFNYRQGIIESNDQLTPPKGVFCKSEGQNLTSLQDRGIGWPNRFSVRVEASSSRSAQWHRFHLRYDRGRRIRYDYLPAGSEDYESVILDFRDNLTYTIDRRVGSCKIKRGVGLPEVNPLSKPIEFFIRHEGRFLFREDEKIWEFNGFRTCRGDSIHCAALTSLAEKFPRIVDPDTGSPSGETWDGTNVEYGWSVRAPFARPLFNREKGFDYPVYLYLRMYRHEPNNPLPFSVHTEDVEYEFYEMSHEQNPNDFDTSICYRANHYDYLHLGFTLKLNRGNIIDGNHLDRRLLEERIHSTLTDTMQIRNSRVTDIEVDHEKASNEVNVLFTLLGPTPRPESPTGLADDEPMAAQSRTALQKSVDEETFKFTMRLTDDSTTEVEFKAVAGSLKGSKLFQSPHATGNQVITNKYTSGAEAGAVIGGLLVGIFIGILVAVAIRVARKEPLPPMPSMSKSFTNPLPNISFYNKKPASDAPTTTTIASSDA
jgi:hypothetical protein